MPAAMGNYPKYLTSAHGRFSNNGNGSFFSLPNWTSALQSNRTANEVEVHSTNNKLSHLHGRSPRKRASFDTATKKLAKCGHCGDCFLPFLPNGSGCCNG